MRYANEEEITWEDASGDFVTVILPQEIQTAFDLKYNRSIEIEEDNELDEIANRRSVFGRDNEDQWFLIFDFNAIKIVDNDFSISGLKILDLPFQI